jgi:hypothetical protein
VLCTLSCFDFYFDGFHYFTCGVSDLVGKPIARDVWCLFAYVFSVFVYR